MPRRDPRELPFVKKPLDFGPDVDKNNKLINEYFNLNLEESELSNLHNSILKRQTIVRKIAKDEKLNNNMMVLGFLQKFTTVPNIFKINDIYIALVNYINYKLDDKSANVSKG